MKNSGWGRSRFDANGPGLPASELWGRAQKDRKHAMVLAPDGRWIVTVRGSGREVKEWGAGKRARDYR